jgi:hypothetical protein
VIQGNTRNKVKGHSCKYVLQGHCCNTVIKDATYMNGPVFFLFALKRNERLKPSLEVQNSFVHIALGYSLLVNSVNTTV